MPQFYGPRPGAIRSRWIHENAIGLSEGYYHQKGPLVPTLKITSAETQGFTTASSRRCNITQQATPDTGMHNPVKNERTAPAECNRTDVLLRVYGANAITGTRG